MPSTARPQTKAVDIERVVPATIRWRSWPLVDHPRWSWLVALGIVAVAAFVLWMGGGWIIAVAAVLALSVALWQFFLPVTFEVCSLGIRRYALRRMRLVPWHAIRAYQLRTTGAAFFQRADATTIDLMRGLFVPYPADADEMVIAIRLYLPHATEVTRL
jgi:hypothetical protein